MTERTGSTTHDVVIVGSGPAGYTAAVYAARAGMKPLLFEGIQPGGALTTTTAVENFPGFDQGIDGPDLMAKMREHAAGFGTVIHTEEVEAMTLNSTVKEIMADDVTYRAHSVILAMGSAARYLGIAREQDLLGRGVSSCATCDGFFFKDQDIVVVGGGDSAMEEATFLTRFARSVTLIHRSENFRASRIMLDRVRANPKIRILRNAAVTSLRGDTELTGIEIVDTSTGTHTVLSATGLFVAIGHDPRSELVRGQVGLDSEGYVRVDGRSSYTSVPGVFACGDLVDATYRQAITAAGSGCTAAIDAERWLAGRDAPIIAIGDAVPAAQAPHLGPTADLLGR